MWTTTCDLLEEGQCIGISPSDYDAGMEPMLKQQFRLLDSDGVAYFEGISDDAESIAAAFEQWMILAEVRLGVRPSSISSEAGGRRYDQLCASTTNSRAGTHRKLAAHQTH